MRNRDRILGALLVGAALLGACQKEEVAYSSALMTKTDFWVDDQQNAAFDQLLVELRQATSRIDLAVTRLPDTLVAEALVTAHEAGVAVRVIGDEDFAADDGFKMLEAAGIEVRWADGELRYLPDPTISPILENCGFNPSGSRVVCPSGEPFMPLSAGEMVRPGSYNLMSHSFAVIDDRVVWNFSASPGVNTIPFAFRLDSQTGWESFWREFNQMWVGVDSIELDQYNGPVKSTGQWAPIYITEHGELQMRFSPQDRVVKSVIDDVYKARKSVWIMADTISEEYLIEALDYKVSAGFDVKIVVSEERQEAETRGRLEDLGAKFIAGRDQLPTLAIIDGEAKGEEFRRGHVSSMPMWRTGPFRVLVVEPDDEVEVFPSDFFTDGVMWTMTAYPDQENPVLDEMIATYRGLYGSAQ